MILRPTLFKTRAQKGGIIALGISGALLVASLLTPASGAWFFASKDGHATITTPSFDLSLSNGDGTSTNGTFDLGFNDLVPGAMNQQTFTVTNTGSIAGSVLLFSTAHINGPNAFDISKLSYGVDGYGSIPLAEGYSNPVNLGVLQAGESRTYSITALLDNYASNEWQGVTITNVLEVSLEQVQ